MLENKSWSYAELTAQVERQISTLMRSARATTNADIRQTYQQYAYGAFLAWSNLTNGGLGEDFKRLENLTSNESVYPKSRRRRQFMEV